MNAVLQAIKAGGGLRSVATKLGVSYQAVQKWGRSGVVPPKRVLAIEAATGVSRHRLRPDLYPLDDSGPSLTINRKCG